MAMGTHRKSAVSGGFPVILCLAALLVQFACGCGEGSTTSQGGTTSQPYDYCNAQPAGRRLLRREARPVIGQMWRWRGRSRIATSRCIRLKR